MKTLISRPPGTRAPEPYRLSYVDKLMGFVARQPIPYWITYLVLFILQATIFHILSWMDGWLAPFTFSPILLVFPLWLWGSLAIMTYLNSISMEALSSFEPLLGLSEEALQRLKKEFTTMPARSVIISAVLWSIMYSILTYTARKVFFVHYGLGPFFTAAIILEGLVSFTIGSVIYYHSLHQLRLVNRTVKVVKHFHLFHLEPVYAFSHLTSQTGLAWVLLLSLTLLTFPIQIATVPVLVVLFLQVVFAIAAFVLPLWIVHHRLVLEKRKLIEEHDRRMEATLARMHHDLEQGELSETTHLYHAIQGLKEERNVLNLIPTWPWRPGLLAGFLSAAVLPVLLFLLQLFLGKWLGK